MREKDIKKIFDTYCGSGEKSGKAEVSSERVKASVMEKIGMSAAESFYTDSQEKEPIKPVFAAVPKKKRNGAALKIAAWIGAAACIGAVVMSMGLFGGNGLSFILQNNTMPTASDTAASGQYVNMELFIKDKNMSLFLMDGMHFTYTVGNENDNEAFRYDHSKIEQYNVVPFLYLKDGILYFDPTDDNKVHPEDITGKINKNDFYLYTYSNSDNPVDSTHYLLMGGDVREGKFGYMEIFKVKNSTNTWGFVSGFSYEYVSGDRFCDPTGPDVQWLAKGIKWLNEAYDISVDASDSNVGCCRRKVDFEYKPGYNYGEDNPYMMPDTEPVKPILEITLLNKGQVKLMPNHSISGIIPSAAITNGLQYFEDSATLTPLIYKEDDRVYFTATVDSEEIKEDVTDKLTTDDCFIYSYNNPDNTVNQTHYVVICGDLSKKEYGCWEVFQIHKAENEWDYDNWQWYGQYSGNGKLDEKEWFINASKVLEKECGVDSTLSSGCCTNYSGFPVRSSD